MYNDILTHNAETEAAATTAALQEQADIASVASQLPFIQQISQQPYDNSNVLETAPIIPSVQAAATTTAGTTLTQTTAASMTEEQAALQLNELIAQQQAQIAANTQANSGAFLNQMVSQTPINTV